MSVAEHRRAIHTLAKTAELVFTVDQVQDDTGEGPRPSTVYEQRTVRLPDVSERQRWPRFTRRTAELEGLSMLSFELNTQPDNLNRPNLYSQHKNAFD
jgi:hypothetical protein